MPTYEEGKIMFSNPPESFDLRRAIVYPYLDPPPFEASSYQPLSDALDSGKLTPKTDVLVMPIGDTTLVFVTLPMVYYHVAYGTFEGQPWMMSFCAACNAGAGFTPVVRGRELHFGAGGFYNGMAILKDIETNSLWDHITGVCLHGELTGERLPQIETARHMLAEQVRAVYPDAKLIQADFPNDYLDDVKTWDKLRSASDHPYIELVASTMGVEDTRLPRLDMGLGVWTQTEHRYYPMSQLHVHDNALIDTFDRRRLLVYVDPDSGNPVAWYTTASSVEWRGNDLILDTGERVRGGTLRDRSGIITKPIYPRQLFMRWYGFAFLFPGSDIYGRR